MQKPSSRAALWVLISLALVSGIGSLLAAFPSNWPVFDPNLARIDNQLLPPLSRPADPATAHCLFGRFLLGTDAVGRDVFLRLIQGTGVALLVGVVTVLLSSLLGVILGILAGYWGRKSTIQGGWGKSLFALFDLDRIITYAADVFLCFPVLFLYLAVAAVLGSSIWVVVLVVGLTSWMKVARLVRAEVLSTKTRDYVRIAEISNTPGILVVWRHILPHSLVPVLVSATVGVAQVILLESTLSFIGVGPPAAELASLGNIISEGKDYLTSAPWLLLAPGTVIVAIVLALNSVAGEFQRRLDPRAAVRTLEIST